MKAKTFKRMSKRFISSLLSVLMVLSLFTVCAVGSTITASAFNASNITITVDASATNWESVYLYIGKDDYVEAHQLTKSGNYYTKSGFSWGGYTGYFFADSGNYSIVNSGNDRLWETYKGIPDGSKSIDPNKSDSNPYWSAISTSTIKISTKGSSSDDDDDDDDNDDITVESTGTYWIPATLFNYRTTNQISDASDEVEDTATKSYNIDSKNGQASPWDSWKKGTYSTYNHAVSDWYAGLSTVTPLYQGNFHDQDDIPSYHNFMLMANAANRANGNDGSSTKAVATGLVDDKLNADGNITQDGREMPQFSKKFMETANATDVIQSVYENLKFEAVATTYSNGNTWYSYDSAKDGNRALVVSDSKIKGISDGKGGYKSVKSCNTGGKEGDYGYFPFNQSTPSTISDVVNSFGNRFDITFTMTSDGKLNDEDLQFEFTGDDDLWVFIDGHLVLDMGGSHNKAKGSFNLNTMTYTINTGYGIVDTYNSGKASNTSTTVYTDTPKPINSEAQKALKDLSKEHTMTIFYMERGMFDSNLSFKFMLPQSNSLTINQKLDTTNVNPGLRTETIHAADLDVHEVILKTDSASAEAGNPTAEIPVVDDFKRVDLEGAYSLFQKGTNSNTDDGTGTEQPTEKPSEPEGKPFINENAVAGTFVPAKNTSFVWSDSCKSADGTKSSMGTGTGVVTNDGGVELLYNQTAVFNDQFKVGSGIQLHPQNALKTFVLGQADSENPPPVKPSGRLQSEYYTTTTSIKNSKDETITLGTNNQFSFGASSDSNAKYIADYTHTVNTGTIEFTKKLVEQAQDNTTVFYFTVEFTDIFGAVSGSFEEYDIEYKVKKADGTIGSTHSYADKENGIELQIGDTAIIEGVPVGTSYRIREVGTSNDAMGYSLSSVTVSSNSKTGAVAEQKPLTDGIIATVGKSITGANNVAKLDFNNTTKATTVVYRFYDRHIEKGLPTSMEDHYTYFTREMPGTLTGTDADKGIIGDYAPTIINPLKTYTVLEEEPESIKFGYTLRDADVANAEGLNGLKAGDKVNLATYTALDREYSVEYTCRDDDGNIITGTVEPPINPATGQRRKGFPFNELIEYKKLKTAQTYTDAEGKIHNFRYWSLNVNRSSTSASLYTPVSSNYSFSYRVTDDLILKAVYDTDEEYYQLPAPICTTGKSYNVTGLGSGHDAVASERIYDSYSKDLADGTTQDRTRMNIMFSAVGSEDTDRNITHIGYVLLYNVGSYATDNLFTEESILEQLKTPNISKIKDINENEYPVQIKSYGVQNHMTLTPSTDENGNPSWTPSDYYSGQVALTNKNRANLVFDLAHSDKSREKYYTCYTIMTRVDYVYDDAGEPIVDETTGRLKTVTYNYVSDTPAYFNLKEAEPYIQDVEIVEDSYPVAFHYKDQDGKEDNRAGSITASSSYVKQGQKLTVYVTPTSYQKNGATMESTLKELKIGNITITEDMFNSYSISKTGKSAYAITFDKDSHLPEGAENLDVIATFNVVENTKDIIVNATKVVCTNGSVQVSKDGTEFTNVITVTKGNSFTAKAVPADGYKLVSWGKNGPTTSTITVQVDSEGKYNIPTPIFEEITYSLTLEAKAGGTITYKYGTTEITVEASKTKTITGIPVNAEVTLTATPTVTGATFQRWSDSSSATATRTYKVSKDKVTLKAYFDVPATNYTIYVADMSSEFGSVSCKTSSNGNLTPMNKLTKKYTKDGTNSYDIYSFTVLSDVSWINLETYDSYGNRIEFYDVTNLFGGKNKLVNNTVFEIKGNNVTMSNFSDWSEGTSTAKKLTFNVGIVNDWAESGNPVFWLTYKDASGNRAVTKLKYISYNYYQTEKAVEVYEDADFTAYLLRCASGYTPSATTTSKIQDKVHNVGSTTINSTYIKNATNGGSFELTITLQE